MTKVEKKHWVIFIGREFSSFEFWIFWALNECLWVFFFFLLEMNKYFRFSKYRTILAFSSKLLHYWNFHGFINVCLVFDNLTLEKDLKRRHAKCRPNPFFPPFYMKWTIY